MSRSDYSLDQISEKEFVKFLTDSVEAKQNQLRSVLKFPEFRKLWAKIGPKALNAFESGILAKLRVGDQEIWYRFVIQNGPFPEIIGTPVDSKNWPRIKINRVEKLAPIISWKLDQTKHWKEPKNAHAQFKAPVYKDYTSSMQSKLLMQIREELFKINKEFVFLREKFKIYSFLMSIQLKVEYDSTLLNSIRYDLHHDQTSDEFFK